jgi:predicted nuclease of predicted toxin-antitoxin system
VAAAPKFLSDVNITQVVTDALRRHGVDVKRCEEVGLRKAHDLDLLAFAEAEQRTIVTHDLKFPTHLQTWSARGRQHYGVILCQPYLQGDDHARRIIEEVLMYHEYIVQGAATVEDTLVNQLHFVS